ncbi:MAG TPA: hypothetical protein VIY86_09680, partial [Pirellulaceae bacterium]
MASLSDVLKLSDRTTIVPVIHGSGDFALEVRRLMMEHRFDCLAVPLSPSFQSEVEQAIEQLPSISCVLQLPPTWLDTSTWSAESLPDGDSRRRLSYVPIDPCQPVIAALRVAMGEHLPRAFIDREAVRYVPHTAVLPDPYALKRVALERFAATLLPALSRPRHRQIRSRIRVMAQRLRELESRYSAILCVCSLCDWPWIREAYADIGTTASCELPEEDTVGGTRRFAPTAESCFFMLGELPFVTGLYEEARREWLEDRSLTLDGIKALLLTAREQYRAEFKRRARQISPQALSLCLKYTRNLALLDRRFSPDLYTLATAAKQVLGDTFALQVVRTARQYPFEPDGRIPVVELGIDRCRLPDTQVVRWVSRLPGVPLVWRSLQLTPTPSRRNQARWQMQWNPYQQCSWPPEDEKIENFRTHVTDRAQAILGADLARTEKFTSSIKDGIDIRETLRNWHAGELYVKILPPARGPLDAVVMLFDSPADPREYPWRTTWYAEHSEESTLAFYATHFGDELLGPGIAVATYGGALFVFPPIAMSDIWRDTQFDFTETLEERLLAAACRYSRSPHIALLSTAPPGAGWRRLARKYRKKWVHVPLSGFGASTIAQLRLVHVLNGRTVRSYA